MLGNNLVQSFIIKDFLNFYYEVIRHRDKIRVGYYQKLSPNGSTEEPAPASTTPADASEGATRTPKTIKETLALRRSVQMPDAGVPSGAALAAQIQASVAEKIKNNQTVLAEEGAAPSEDDTDTNTPAPALPPIPEPAPPQVAPQTSEQTDLPQLLPEASGTDLATYISARLGSLLESQALYAIQQGGEYVSEYYREAQYIMAALGDEVFLNFDWSGRTAWENTLLESELFQSHEAGARFFEKLDAFLQKREAGAAELGLIYLYALGLGFQGQYRGQMDQTPLDYYRRALYEFIFHTKPTLLVDIAPICPDALNYTLEGHTQKSLPNPRFWGLVLVSVVAACLLFSLGLWIYLTHPLIAELKAVMAFAPKGSVMP